MVVGAGYYVPELAKLVFDRNKQLTKEKKINFKGFMVSNLAHSGYMLARPVE